MLRVIALFVLEFCIVGADWANAADLKLVPIATFYDGNRQDAYLVGDTLYVASATGLEVFDISVPAEFLRMAQVIRPDGGVRVAAGHHQVALATASDSLLVFEWTGAGLRERITAFSTQGSVRVLQYYRGDLYAADSVGWFRINFPVGGSPVMDSRALTEAPVEAFGVRGDSLYAVESDGAVVIYNVAGLPSAIDTFLLRPSIRSLVFLDSFACAAVGDSGVVVYDLDRPEGPAEISRFYTYGNAIDLWSIDSLLCVADSTRGLLVLALRDPYHPFLLGAAGQPDGSCSITGNGSNVAVAAANGLFVFSISDPLRVRMLGRQGGDYRVGNLAAEKNLLAACVEGMGLALLSITDPAKPVVLSETMPMLSIRGVDVHDNIAALAAGEDGLVLVDITDPTSPNVLYQQPTIGSALDVVLDDTLAVVADGNEGFRVFDIHDPAHAHLIGGKSTTSAVTEVSRRGNFVFAVGPDLGLEVYDISFAFKPRRVFDFKPNDRTRGITLADQRAFLAVDSGGIFVFDILQPAAPRFLERLDMIHHPQHVAVDAGLVLVVDDSMGVVLIDNRFLGSARMISSLPITPSPTALAHAGDAVYVSAEPYLYALAIEPPSVLGDVNESGSVSLADVVYLVNCLFRRGPLPLRLTTADADANGRLNTVDLVRLIRLVFPL